VRFSERVGATQPPKSGLEDAPTPLRTALWNALHGKLFTETQSGNLLDWQVLIARNIWDHIGWQTDQLVRSVSHARNQLKDEYWYKCSWYQFFDLIEFAARQLAATLDGSEGQVTYVHLNSRLEAQGCPYRFVAEQLAPITNPIELAEVARASDSAIPAVSTHIRTALSLLPPNPNPGARNSIKESISAVEAALRSFSGDAGASLAGGLKVFEQRYGPLHPALRKGLSSLYGYTSDERGIRHALSDETGNVTIDDAQFMLVVCSAFANYLVSLSASRPQ
jgi:hypothetical protein